MQIHLPKVSDENPRSEGGSFEDSEYSDYNAQYIQSIYLHEEEEKEPKVKKTEMISLWTKMTELLKNQIREDSQHANDAIKKRHF